MNDVLDLQKGIRDVALVSKGISEALTSGLDFAQQLQTSAAELINKSGARLSPAFLLGVLGLIRVAAEGQEAAAPVFGRNIMANPTLITDISNGTRTRKLSPAKHGL